MAMGVERVNRSKGCNGQEAVPLIAPGSSVPGSVAMMIDANDGQGDILPSSEEYVVIESGDPPRCSGRRAGHGEYVLPVIDMCDVLNVLIHLGLKVRGIWRVMTGVAYYGKATGQANTAGTSCARPSL